MSIRTRTYGTSGPTVVVLHGGPGAPGDVALVARGPADSFRVLEPLQRASGGEPLTVARADIPGSAVKKYAKRYVHTAETFLAGVTLRSGRPQRFGVRLEPERTLLSMDEMRDRRNPDRRLSLQGRPGRARSQVEARTFIDVVLARDIKVQRDVSVLVD